MGQSNNLRVAAALFVRVTICPSASLFNCHYFSFFCFFLGYGYSEAGIIYLNNYTT